MTPQSLINIHTAVVHCSATIEGVWVTAADIDKWHRERKPPFAMIGYHDVILLDGEIERGRPYERRGAHVAGNNINTVGICMVGGLDKNRKPKDTFSGAQKSTLLAILLRLKELCPNLVNIKGHRDYSPDLNGDGIITPDEWIKDCPCWDVQLWVSHLGKYGYNL